MSEVLRRWSRLKRAAAAGTAPAAAPPGAPDTPQIDPAELPSLDSLGPDSDYSVLLRAGVPAALRLAGLRKAWTSDPAIAGFRGFGEYDWDFNAPGYGAWTGTAEEALRLAEAMLGPPPDRRDLEPRADAAVAETDASRPDDRAAEPGPEDREGAA